MKRYLLMYDTTANFISESIVDIAPIDKGGDKTANYVVQFNLDKPECPNPVYLNFSKSKYKRRNFDFYPIKHICSRDLWSILNSFSIPQAYTRDVIICVDGEPLSLEKKYIMYSFNDSETKEFIDYEQSILCNIPPLDLFLAPEKLIFTEKASQYDVFELASDIVTGNSFVITEQVKNTIEKQKFKSFKIVPLEDSFSEYCQLDPYAVMDYLKSKNR